LTSPALEFRHGDYGYELAICRVECDPLAFPVSGKRP
jgi:hypothetical protein